MPRRRKAEPEEDQPTYFYSRIEVTIVATLVSPEGKIHDGHVAETTYAFGIPVGDPPDGVTEDDQLRALAAVVSPFIQGAAKVAELVGYEEIGAVAEPIIRKRAVRTKSGLVAIPRIVPTMGSNPAEKVH
jgi:hypothetical protein